MARNEKFQQLVQDVISAAMTHHCSKAQSGYQKVFLFKYVCIHEFILISLTTKDGMFSKLLFLLQSMLSVENLAKLTVAEGPSVADQLALTIGKRIQEA